MTVFAGQQNLEEETHATFLAFYIVAVTRSLHYATSFFLLLFLAPTDFGLMAVAMSVIALMNSFSNLGIDSALISHQGDVHHLLDDAWTLELIRGIAIWILLLSVAPLIAAWFSAPVLGDILGLLGSAFIFQAAKNIGLVPERKSFKLKNLFICELAMSVTSLMVTLTIAAIHGSPWAIAFGYISGWAVFCIVSHVCCSYRPQLSLIRANYQSLLGYSRWILLSSQVNTVVEHGINIFVGSQFGMAVLGQFERADLFTRKTVLQVGEVIWKIGLPSLSARSTNLGELSAYYIGLYRFICFIAFPSLLIIVLHLASFVDASQSISWPYFEELLRIMGLVALASLLTIPAGVLFQAQRAPYISLRIAIMRFIIIGILAFPAVHLYQHLGIAYALLISATIVVPISLTYVKRIIGITLARHFLIALEYLAPSTVFFIDIFPSASIAVEITEISLKGIAYIFLVFSVSRQSREHLIDVIKAKNNHF